MPATSDRRETLRWCREIALHLLLMQRKFDQAEARCRIYIAADPGDAELYNVRSTILTELGMGKAALEELVKGYELNKNDAGLQNNLGYLYADNGVNLDQAESLIRSALAARPTEPAYLDSLGWVLYKKGRFSESAAAFERIFQISRDSFPGAALMYFHMGDVNFRLGWIDKALSCWVKAMELARMEKDLDSETKMILDSVPGRVQAAELGQVPPLAPAAGDSAGKKEK